LIDGTVLSTAADATVGQLQKTAEGRSGLIHNQGLLDAHLALSKLVLNYRVSLATLQRKYLSDESGLARSELAHE
jgi:hypothetical protein